MSIDDRIWTIWEYTKKILTDHECGRPRICEILNWYEHESAIGYKWRHTEWYSSHFQHIKVCCIFCAQSETKSILTSFGEWFCFVFQWREVFNSVLLKTCLKYPPFFFVSTLWVTHTNCGIVLKFSVKMCWKSFILILYSNWKNSMCNCLQKSIIYSKRKDMKY